MTLDELKNARSKDFLQAFEKSLQNSRSNLHGVETNFWQVIN